MSADRLFEGELLKLRNMRDELKLQIHLGGAELRDLFDTLENKWHAFERGAAEVGRVAAEEGEDVREATKLLLEEIRDGYRHIRKSLH